MNHKTYTEEHSGLHSTPLSRTETIAVIIGTNIGAGVLGMAYAARKTGYLPLAVCLVFTCIICVMAMLYVAEVCLRTKGNNQLSGLSRHYLGGLGGALIFFAVAANSYGALFAYMSGSGRILMDFFADYGMRREWAHLIFFIPSALVLFLGLKALGVGEKIISSSMILILMVLVAATLMNEHASVNYLWESNWQYMVPIFNLAVFVFGAQFIVPELVRGNMTTPKRIPRLIIGGMTATLLLIMIIPASVIMLVGTEHVGEVATLTWGKSLGNWAYYTANTFALLAMLTSYWGLGGSLFTNIFDFFRLGDESHKGKRLLVLAIVGIPPLVLLYSGFDGFVNALYFAGTVGGVMMGIVPILLLNAARRHGDREPEFVCGWYAHPVMQCIIVTIFAASAVYALASVFDLLPSGW
ncbi:amino acid permease [Neisseria sp. HSC-16F19]|nr:amino acid permease [Neisseria sp. HSC-16F19]MCP2039750.1 amino acid permease [Neisseria sp. HSC-16F19]